MTQFYEELLSNAVGNVEKEKEDIANEVAKDESDESEEVELSKPAKSNDSEDKIVG